MTELPRVAVRKVSSGPHKGVVVVDSILDHFLQTDGDLDGLFQHGSSLLKSGTSTRSTLVTPDTLSGDPVSLRSFATRVQFIPLSTSLSNIALR